MHAEAKTHEKPAVVMMMRSMRLLIVDIMLDAYFQIGVGCRRISPGPAFVQGEAGASGWTW
jgi:hypothetical protein